MMIHMTQSGETRGIEGTELYARLREAAQDTAARKLVTDVKDVWDDCAQLAKTILRRMPEFTLHDEVHSLGVAEIMARLLPDPVLKRLRPMELSALLLSAPAHDLGMAPSEDEVSALTASVPQEGSEEEWLKYRAFREGYPRLMARHDALQAQDRGPEAQYIEAYMLCQYIRKTHAERTRKLLFDRFESRLVYGGYEFVGRLASVCASHDSDISSVFALPCWELVQAPGEYCNWRFVAVLLRLADILDFDAKRTPAVLFEHLGVRDAVSVAEWKKHMAIHAWDIAPGRIVFAAQSPDPVIEKTIRTFLVSVDDELASASTALSRMHDPEEPNLRANYDLQLAARVDASQIRPEDGPEGPLYEYVDVSFHLDQERIMSLLMGIALYAERDLFIRELLQNAADACGHRAAMHRARPELGPYEPQVSVGVVEINGEEYIEVEDNGVGMDDHIIRNYFARLGRSYYTSEESHQQSAGSDAAFRPVSQFGIGVHSAFMAGDVLTVETRRVGGNTVPKRVEIGDEGGLFWFRKGSRQVPGTTIRLRLNKPLKHLLRRNEPAGVGQPGADGPPSLRATVERLAPHLDVPLVVRDGSGEYQIRPEWKLPQDEPRCDNYLRCWDLDLTADAPAGLDGEVRVFILWDGKAFVSEVAFDEDVPRSDPEWGDVCDHDLRDRLEQKRGYIQHVHVDRSVKEGLTESWSTEIGSVGRWSQLGFLVPYPLFFEGGWLNRPTGPVMPLPFAVYYDINLTGDFCLPLSLDRKNVLPTVEAWAVCDQVALAISNLLLRSIGPDEVSANLSFLQDVAQTKRGDREPFVIALDQYRGAHSHRLQSG